MYTVTVRDHFMIAHSFQGDAFGPAQALHGATYNTDASFYREQLDANGMVVDIAKATDVLKEVLARYNLKNLDEMAEFSGINTTTEYLAGHIAQALIAAIHEGRLGEGARQISRLKVTLHESHVASAAYEQAL